MIAKVVHGRRVGGLIAYLLGPGRAQEHVDPRVIASWDGRDAVWQPRSPGPSPFGLDLEPLIGALRAPVLAAGLDESANRGRGFVWHCSVRVAAGDRVLSDPEWAGVARELLDGAGVAARGDRGGRGGWPSATLMITCTSPWSWCGRTPAGGFGRATTTRG